jgi:hypothetical protein
MIIEYTIDSEWGWEMLGISFKANSTLAFVFAISLVAYYFGIYVGNSSLSSAALPFVEIFGIVWGIFIVLSLGRNFKSLSK